MGSRVKEVTVEGSPTGSRDGRSALGLGRRVVLTSAIAALSTVGLVGTALAYHKATYTATYTNGQLGPVTHYSDHASATGTTRTNDGNKHYIGARVSYLEYYLGFWHTTGGNGRDEQYLPGDVQRHEDLRPPQSVSDRQVRE